MTYIAGTGASVNGGGGADVIVSSGLHAGETIVSGGGGDDVIFADMGAITVDTGAGNGTRQTAISIDDPALWSTAPHATHGTMGVPVTTIVSTGAGQQDFFTVTLAAGQTLTLDVDAGWFDETTSGVDTVLAVLNASNAVLATNDDGAPDRGGLGNYDSALTFTATVAGVYYIRVGSIGEPTSPLIPAGTGYVLNVSSTGHAATAPVVVSGDTIDGGDGSDTLFAGEGDDRLIGGGGVNTIYGHGGSDTLSHLGGTGRDVFDGGAGFDAVDFSGWSQTSGVVATLGSGAVQTLAGGSQIQLIGIERLLGSALNDSLTGGALDDVLDGADGNDSLTGGLGHDRLDGGAGHDAINGGNGDDWIVAGLGSDFVTGGMHYDTLDLSASNLRDIDCAFSIALSDDLSASVSFSTIERIIGTTLDDLITMAGQGMTVEGRDGDDIARVTFGWETVDGGDGRDRIDASALHDGVIAVDLATGATNGDAVYLNFEDVTVGDASATIGGTDDANTIRTGDGNDVIDGRGGDDSIACGLGDDAIEGGDGVDRLDLSAIAQGIVLSLRTTAAQETGAGLKTISGFEVVIATSGDDRLVSNGLAALYAGAGDDRVTITADGGVAELIDGGEGFDTLDASDLAAGTLWTFDLATGVSGTGGTFTGFEAVTSGASLDDITGHDGDDVIATGGGADSVRAGGGADRIGGGEGADHLAGEAGDDWIAGGAGDDRIEGGEGFDTADYAGATAAVTVRLGIVSAQDTGGAGRDTLAGIEAAIGSTFADSLVGTAGANTLSGGGGNDSLNAAGGDDLLDGGEGGDNLLGGNGIDTLHGGEGNDTLNGQLHADTMAGGTGDDQYYVDDAGDVVTEASAEGFDSVRSSIGYVLGDHVERLFLLGQARSGTGNALDNGMQGSEGADVLAGLDGNDTLRGNNGTDTIEGGAGNDFLYGGALRDVLTGGTGADQFRFETLADSSILIAQSDRITDFRHNEGDRIVLGLIDADSVAEGDQAFAFIGAAAFSGAAGELRAIHQGSDTVVQLDVNGDRIADMLIRLTGTISLAANDFAL